MVVNLDRFKASENEKFSSTSSDTKITNNIFSYVENGLLIFLTASIFASPYIANNTYNSYLQIFTMIYVIIQSFIKARNLIAGTKDLKSKSSIIKFFAFIGAFVLAMLGLNGLENSMLDTSKMWTALNLSTFSYGVSDIVVNEGNVNDLIANGVSAFLLLTGVAGFFFNKNIMGVCCLLSLVVKSLKGFYVVESAKKNVKYNYWYSIMFGVVSLLIVLYCYARDVNLDLPRLSYFFSESTAKVN